ncbi:unnamed protein product [Prorocentrum cordatum]|uniref:DUF4931 domain-containing protein n=1 Tax=Prorocentrum cordatum TaxID=2364126 RepID=A0ABN9TQZ2_9DINO|nr:unnamed protein product [Polarella glacialis]
MMVLYFKQYGPLSGGSLVHPHMQIMALPIVTPEMQLQIAHAQQYHDKFGRCLKCHALRDELLRDDLPRQRLLYESPHFLAVMPFAGRAFHVSVVPRAHSHTWLGIGREEVDDLAGVVQLLMETLYHLLDDPSYIISGIFSVDSPRMLEEFGDSVKDAFHWGLEI